MSVEATVGSYHSFECLLHGTGFLRHSCVRATEDVGHTAKFAAKFSDVPFEFPTWLTEKVPAIFQKSTGEPDLWAVRVWGSPRCIVDTAAQRSRCEVQRASKTT